MTGAPSVHLTFSISNPTGLDYLTWLGERLAASPAFAAELPQFDEEALRSRAAEFRSALLAELESAHSQAFLTQRSSPAPWRHGLGLPFSLGIGEAISDELEVRLAVSGPVVRGQGQDDRTELRAGGRRWELSSEAASIIELLEDGQSWSVGRLRAARGDRRSPDLLSPLLSHFLRCGLVCLSPKKHVIGE
jgi:hypothetical protein